MINKLLEHIGITTSLIVVGVVFILVQAYIPIVPAQEYPEYPDEAYPEGEVVVTVPPDEVPPTIPPGMETEFATEQNLSEGWERPDIANREGEIISLGKTLRPGVVRLGFQSEEFDQEFQGTGTGFLVHEDGYLFTNAHVVEGMDKLKMQTLSGDVYDVQILAAADPMNVDVAILKVNSVPSGMKVLEFGDGEPQRGDVLFNVGHPAIFGDWVIKAGGYMGVNFGDMVLDMPGSQGDSGSPLFNMNGEIVGIIHGATNLEDRPKIGPDDDVVIWWGNFTKYYNAVGTADPQSDMKEFVSQHLEQPIVDEIFNVE